MHLHNNISLHIFYQWFSAWLILAVRNVSFPVASSEPDLYSPLKCSIARQLNCWKVVTVFGWRYFAYYILFMQIFTHIHTHIQEGNTESRPIMKEFLPLWEIRGDLRVCLWLRLCAATSTGFLRMLEILENTCIWMWYFEGLKSA